MAGKKKADLFKFCEINQFCDQESLFLQHWKSVQWSSSLLWASCSW